MKHLLKQILFILLNVKTKKMEKNQPYVKKYNKEGLITNPIPTGYFHDAPNRRERKLPLQKEKLFGRIPQYILYKDGKKKTILHTRQK